MLAAVERATRVLPEKEVLAEAYGVLPADTSTVGGAFTVMADNGIHNFDGQVDAFFKDSRLERVLAHINVSFSNSMIEASWRSLKHGWLFLNQLDTFSRLQKLIAFYVQQHNQVMPHSAFQGQTPDEVFAGAGNQVPEHLAQQHRAARQERIEINCKLSCDSRFFADPQPDTLPPQS